MTDRKNSVLYDDRFSFTASIATENGDELCITYKLIVTPDSFPYSSEYGKDVYSLLVISESPVGGTETVFAYDISRDRQKAESIVLTLSRNRATLSSVREILDDIL